MPQPKRKLLIALIGIPIIVMLSVWGISYTRNLAVEGPETDPILEETKKPEESASADWWLYSGGYAIFEGELLMTLQGSLPPDDKQRRSYLRTNPLDTDNGYHPQNVFQIFSKSSKENVSQRVYFYINADQLSLSPNRNENNGVFLISRFKNIDNYYAIGLRVDGKGVIRKKVNGKFYTLAETNVFTTGTYDRDISPNLMPKKVWMGIKSDIRTDSGGQVEINLSGDLDGTGQWELITQAVDTDSPVTGAGYSGFKSDFMDILFTSYNSEETE